jgi:hypothetical protein
LVGSQSTQGAHGLTSTDIGSVLQTSWLAECTKKRRIRIKGRKYEKAHHPVDTAHLLEVILGKVTETNVMVEVFLPTLDAAVDANRDVALLANNTAVAASLVASSQVSESICKIVELGTLKHLWGHMVLEPEDFGHLHLDAHLSTNVLEELVVGVVDLFGLFDRSVVEPQDDIAVVAIICEVRSGDRKGLVSVVSEDGKRAGGVEANALDAGGVDGGLADNATDTFADALPDICGGLFLCESQIMLGMKNRKCSIRSSRSQAAIA